MSLVVIARYTLSYHRYPTYKFVGVQVSVCVCVFVYELHVFVLLSLFTFDVAFAEHAQYSAKRKFRFTYQSGSVNVANFPIL